MAALWKWYNKCLQNHAIKTQAIQTAVLMAAGDVIAQVAVEKTPVENIDLMRTTRFASFGFIVAGPTLKLWYGVLEHRITTPGFRGVLKRVATDQLVFSPSFLIVFLGGMGTLQGETIEKIKARIKRDYWEILSTNWMVWPAVQLVNFHFFPLQYRVLVAQVVALFWNTYLAWVTNR